MEMGREDPVLYLVVNLQNWMILSVIKKIRMK